jgi:glycosyltransferase involved in cell wall biosynthesis
LAVPLPAVRHACYRGSRAQSALMATALTVHRGTWRAVDRYLALTDAIAAHLRDFGIPDERIVVKPNSTPDPGPPAPLGDGFLFVGRLSAEKGVALMLDAWARRPVGTLRIVGDGPLRPLVESRSDVVFLGPQNQEGVRAAMRDSAVLLVPSTWHDVLPTVILEALAAGRPVLGTDLGGIPYLIGDAGWTVPATVDALAAALPAARASAAGLAAAARKRYESTFTPELLTGRLVDVYRSLTG